MNLLHTVSILTYLGDSSYPTDDVSDRLVPTAPAVTIQTVVPKVGFRPQIATHVHFSRRDHLDGLQSPNFRGFVFILRQRISPTTLSALPPMLIGDAPETPALILNDGGPDYTNRIQAIDPLGVVNGVATFVLHVRRTPGRTGARTRVGEDAAGSPALASRFTDLRGQPIVTAGQVIPATSLITVATAPQTVFNSDLQRVSGYTQLEVSLYARVTIT